MRILFELFPGLICLAVGGGLVYLLVMFVIWLGRKLHQDGNNLRPGIPQCVNCGRQSQMPGGVCPYCSAPVSRGVLLSDLQATVRQLQRLHEQGRLADSQQEELMAMLRVEHARLTCQPVPEPVLQPSTRSAEAVASPALPQPPARPAEVVAEDAPVTCPLPERLSSPFKPASPPVEHLSPVVASNVHPLDRPVEVEFVEPSVPSRSAVEQGQLRLAELLQTFMQEKNIRWGELLSGLLIVGSAVGLVISLRATLNAAIPYFPALLFMLGTAAIHGAGIYTLRRWNLRSTSRGVLVIGSLLAPLNFFAASVLAGSGEQMRPLTDPAYLAAVTIGLLSFGGMVYLASRALMPQGWQRLWLAILGPSVGQLLINRLAGGPLTTLGATLLLAPPLTAFLVAGGWQLARAQKWRAISAGRAGELYLLLGTGTFSFAVALGLLLVKSPETTAVMASLAPSLSLALAVLLAAGLLLHNRTRGPRLATQRLLGTSTAVLAGMLMVGTVALAWPRPELLVAVGLVNFLLLSALAVLARLPVLHPAALGCLTFAVLTGLPAASGQLELAGTTGAGLVQCLLSGRSGAVLTGLALAVWGAAAVWRRWRRTEDAVQYLATAVGLLAIGLVMAVQAGFRAGVQEAGWAAPLLLLDAGLLLAGGAGLLIDLRRSLPGYGREWRMVLTWGGSALLLAALVQGLVWNAWVREGLAWATLLPEHPWLLAAMAHAGLTLLLAGGWLVSKRLRGPAVLADPFVGPLLVSAMAISGLALVGVCRLPQGHYGMAGGYTLGIAFVWLGAAIAADRRALFTVFQSLLTLGAGLLLLAVGLHYEAWNGRLFDLYFAAWVLLASAGWCAFWPLLRVGLRRWEATRRLLSDAGGTVDRALLAASVGLLLFVAIASAGPAVLAELGSLLPVGVLGKTFVLAAQEAIGGVTGWAILALAAATVVACWERGSTSVVVWGCLLGAAAAWWGAAQASEAVAAASTLRWLLAGFAVLVAAAVCGRQWLEEWLQRCRLLNERADFRGAAPTAATLSLVLAVGPILMITGATVLLRLAGETLGGPLAGTLFARLGPELSFLAPLLLLAGVFWAFAIRERQPILAVGATVLGQIGATLGFLLYMADSPLNPAVKEVLCWHTNVVALACSSWLWFGLARWTGERDERASHWLRAPFLIQRGLTLLLASAAPVLAIASILLEPQRVDRYLATLGLWPAWLGLLLAAGLVLWQVRVRWQWERLLPTVLVLFAGLGGAALQVRFPSVPWLGYHLLTACWLAGGGASVVWATLVRRQEDPARVLAARECAGVLIGATVCWALAGFGGDPWPEWSGGMLLGSVLVLCCLGWSTPWRRLEYVSGLLAPVGVFLLLASSSIQEQGWLNLASLMLAAAMMVALWWEGLEVRRQQSDVAACLGIGAAPWAAIGGGLLLLVWSGGGLLLTSVVRSHLSSPWVFDFSGWATWFAWLAWIALLTLALWDRRQRFALPCLYMAGLVLAALLLDKAEDFYAGPLNRMTPDLAVRVTFAAVGVLLGAYGALTGWLWRQGGKLARRGTRLGVPETSLGLQQVAQWLPGMSVVLALIAAGVSSLADLGFADREVRVLAAFGPVLAAAGLAFQAEAEQRDWLQRLSLLLATFSALLVSWADMPPGWEPAIVLSRAIRILVVLSALAVAFPLGAGRWFPAAGWRDSLMEAARGCCVAAIAALLGVLACEAAYFGQVVGYTGAPIDGVQTAVVAVALSGLMGVLLWSALASERATDQPDDAPTDLEGAWKQMFTPTGMPWRMAYVYAAQLVGGLLFAHFYLASPEWFGGVVRTFWPYLVLLLAGLGVGAGEVFRRRGLVVLGEPLQRTASLLPLVPLAAIWALPAGHPLAYESLGVSGPLVALLAGLVYVGLAATRRSLASALAACAAGNLALWLVLGESGFDWRQNPQLWLIPPAISVLIAAQVQRDRLERGLLTAVRYGAISVIYLSSTAELMLSGEELRLWPPMVLMGLSAAGVLAGIMLQVRAFLYYGSFFVLLAILSMVSRAAQAIEHVWPWWAFGMALGVCILVLFGLFEMKREQINAWIGRVRTWEP
ncbi:hypothetical protein [Lignipirellula cremea]|nr:hypothetical protein [Lignipirellula cremea]